MYRKLFIATSAALAMSACAPGDAQVTYTEDLSELASDDYDTRTILVGYQTDGPQIRLRGTELNVMRDFARMGIAELEVPADEDALDVIEELRGSWDVTFVEPNLVRTALATPNDPYLAYQWNLPAINAEGAWAYSTGSGAVVAVIDTGVSKAGSDTPANFVSGYDFVDGDSDPTDLNGHGTHVSGTIAQATNNSVGVAGVAYDASIMAVRVLDANGSGTSADVIAGIEFAADNGADIINMSLGSRYGSTAEQTAVQYADSKGVLTFAASGNDGSRRSISYPAAYAEAVAVGSVGYGNTVPRYSNRGNELELVAPGGDTSKDDNGDGYADGILQETFESGAWGYYFWQGTSMATPHAAAVGALLSSMGATNDEIRQIMQDTAQDLDAAGWDKNTGYGLIDAEAAVRAYTGDTGTVDTGTVDTGTTDTGTVDTGTADTTAPVISGVSHAIRGRKVQVTWNTDEAATGEVCFDDGACGTTSLGTSHTANVRTNGSSYTITATDAAGNSSSDGPNSL